MKKSLSIICICLFICGLSHAQDDTMYVHQSSGLVTKIAVAVIDSIVFYPSESPNVVVDVDGNVYTIVQIGAQSWLGQNLKVTHYNDGTPIPLQTDPDIWDTLTNHAYCWYDNNIANKEPYGALYNWFVTNSAVNGGKNPCPVGWHVPDDDEWTALTDYLGGSAVAGGKLKEAGTVHWEPPNSGATNETGFTALPGGNRGTGASFVLMGTQGNWWTAFGHPTFTSSAYYRSMSSSSVTVYRSYLGKTFGMSIRCIRD